ncbi:MAG: 2-oxoacid:ferredoxin oxidoreductase subunit beta [Verrucomicrobia bacterium]|nr:2-oxoacid:ferredoxin oxidoreductase subunit beta [Verrucomicrobiota bacterium]MDA1067524.1 2-oxoacid:ferredoxin oxidoreductase subunit beta [Verrucomicrobiota bacterium]
MTTEIIEEKQTKKDFVTPNDVRWCPGCGDYAILNSLQRTLPELGIPKENYVVVSGIGCSSRFPYYMNTYGFHTIHGRAPTVTTGVKVANPDLSVWMITGDGDGLSIGGNHLMHVLRRNVNINILLFNNRVYGLTKGQYSPTSPVGTKTKTTPMGSIDNPLNPILFALGAEATFIARTIDTNPKHMMETFKAAHEHQGVSFVEILQNCVIFNDKTWDPVYGRENRDNNLLHLEDGQPMVFGKEEKKGIVWNGSQPEIITLGDASPEEKNVMIHTPDRPGSLYTAMLAEMTFPDFPTPIGVLRKVEKPTYDAQINQQVDAAIDQRDGKADLQELINGAHTWTV